MLRATDRVSLPYEGAYGAAGAGVVRAARELASAARRLDGGREVFAAWPVGPRAGDMPPIWRHTAVSIN